MVHSFSVLYGIPRLDRVYLPTLLLMDSLACFQFGAIMNRVALLLMLTFIYFYWIYPGVEIWVTKSAYL